MGEAGPEAIMPLTRAADGSLGVRAVGSMNGSAGWCIPRSTTLPFRMTGLTDR
ncbi:tail length tape measure protein [Escherichia coli]|nr:tail length tape measure protein [Escherichia coli]